MWASKAPDLIAALVQRFTAWPELVDAEVAVRDGPQIASEAVDEVLTVGYTAVPGETDVESEITLDGLGNPDRELCTIRCTVGAILGSGNLVEARARAYELLAMAGSAIASDRTLNRLAMRAQITSLALEQSQLSTGAQAVIVFTVECDCFTTR